MAVESVKLKHELWSCSTTFEWNKVLGYLLGLRLGHATLIRCEELGEILSKEMLTNKLGEYRLIQSSAGILSIYLLISASWQYILSLSLIIFSCNAEVHGRVAVNKDKKTYQPWDHWDSFTFLSQQDSLIVLFYFAFWDERR